MNKSESIKNLAIALSKFQADVKNPANSANNPFFKSKYAPLNEILNDVRPLLTKYGLSVVQAPGGDGNNILVTTMLLHESGEYLEFPPLTLKADKATAQGAGSAITYARRYALSAVLGISSEDDDDGNHATYPNGKTEDKPNKKEDKPKVDGPNIDSNKVDAIRELANVKGVSEEYICKFRKVTKFEELSLADWTAAMEWLKKK